MPSLGQQLSSGGGIFYIPSQKNSSAVTTAHAIEYINRARELTRRMSVASLRNVRLDQAVNRLDILRQNELMATRQARLAELAEAQARYFDQFGSVLNDKALGFLDQMSNISAPTFTAILAGYEHARASHADMEKARIKEYERVMNLENELQKERLALRKQALDNEVSVAKAMNEQMITDAKNYWQINKDAVQMYGGTVNVPTVQNPAIIGGSGRSRLGGYVSSDESTGTSLSDIGNALAAFGTPSSETNKASTGTVSDTNKSDSKAVTTTSVPDERPKMTSEEKAQIGAMTLPGLPEAYSNWIRHGWTPNVVPENFTAYQHDRGDTLANILALRDSSDETERNKYNELVNQVMEINNYLSSKNAPREVAGKKIRYGTPEELYTSLMDLNIGVDAYKNRNAGEANININAQGGGKPTNREEMFGPDNKGQGEQEPQEETKKEGSWLRRVGDEVGNFATTLGENLGVLPASVQAAEKGEIATSTENPTGQPTSNVMGSAETTYTPSAQFLTPYFSSEAALRYQVGSQSEALKGIDALSKAGKLTKDDEEKVTSLLESGELPSDVLNAAQNKELLGYMIEKEAERKGVTPDYSKYRLSDDALLQRWNDESKADLSRNTESLYERYPALNWEMREQEVNPVYGRQTRGMVGNVSDSIKDATEGSEYYRTIQKAANNFRMTDYRIETELAPYLQTMEQVNAFKRLNAGINNKGNSRRFYPEDVTYVKELLRTGTSAEEILNSLEKRGPISSEYKPIIDSENRLIRYGVNPDGTTQIIPPKTEEATSEETGDETSEIPQGEDQSMQTTQVSQEEIQPTQTVQTQVVPEDDGYEDRWMVFQGEAGDERSVEQIEQEVLRSRMEREEANRIEAAVIKHQLGSSDDVLPSPPETETTIYGRPRNEVRVGDPRAIRAAEADDRRRWTFRREAELMDDLRSLVEESYRAYGTYMASPEDGVVDFNSIPGPRTGQGRGLIIPAPPEEVRRRRSRTRGPGKRQIEQQNRIRSRLGLPKTSSTGYEDEYSGPLLASLGGTPDVGRPRSSISGGGLELISDLIDDGEHKYDYDEESGITTVTGKMDGDVIYNYIIPKNVPYDDYWWYSPFEDHISFKGEHVKLYSQVEPFSSESDILENGRYEFVPEKVEELKKKGVKIPYSNAKFYLAGAQKMLEGVPVGEIKNKKEKRKKDDTYSEMVKHNGILNRIRIQGLQEGWLRRKDGKIGARTQEQVQGPVNDSTDPLRNVPRGDDAEHLMRGSAQGEAVRQKYGWNIKGWGSGGPANGELEPANFVGRNSAIADFVKLQGDKYGISDQENLANAYNFILNSMMMSESGAGTLQRNPKSSARGVFHFLTSSQMDSFGATKRIATELFRGKSQALDAFIQRINAAKRPQDLSPYDQGLLALIHDEFGTPDRGNRSQGLLKKMVAVLQSGGNGADSHLSDAMAQYIGLNHNTQASSIPYYRKGAKELIAYMARSGARFK